MASNKHSDVVKVCMRNPLSLHLLYKNTPCLALRNPVLLCSHFHLLPQFTQLTNVVMGSSADRVCICCKPPAGKCMAGTSSSTKVASA